MSLYQLCSNLLELEASVLQFHQPHLKYLSIENYEVYCLVERVSSWCKLWHKEIKSSPQSLQAATCSSNSTVTMCVKAGLDRVWEILNIGSWKDVPEHMKHIFTLLSFYKVLDLVASVSCSQWTLLSIEECIHTLDRGMLLGYNNSHVSKAMQYLMDNYKSKKKLEERDSQNVSADAVIRSTWNNTGIRGTPLSTVSRPGLLTFQAGHLWPRIPVKLTDCTTHWPALDKWTLLYFRDLAGPRLVPVELGKKYTDEDWSQRLMSFNEFLDRHMSETSHAYLAQHDLLSQIPELKRDIYIPDYCYLHTDENNIQEESRDVDLNIWFGPPGTVTPFHWDAKHNLLVQVLGNKRVLMVAPECNMSPYEGLLNNTSPVDPESEPELLAREFPEFLKHPVHECILQPGDMLYIPPKYWHHVRSLSTSISVSFWFE